MSCPVVVQNTTASVSFYLGLSAGGDATGLTESDITLSLSKDGGVTYVPKTLAIGQNLFETGDGVYRVLLGVDQTGTTQSPVEDTDTLGNLYIRVTGVTITTALTSVYVSETATVTPSAALTIGTTTMFGYVTDVDGSPLANAGVSARPLAVPTVGTSGGEGYTASEGLITAKTNADGYFQMALVTGAQVDFFIPSANYRRTFTVPATSTNVFDLP